MKIIKHTPLLALLFVSGILNAQTIIPAPGLEVNGTAKVTGTTLLNGTLTVQPAVSTITSPTVVVPGTGTSTAIGGIVPAGTGGPIILTSTILDTRTDANSVTGAGGATIQTNGDTELNASSVVNTTVTYRRVVTQEVAQAGNANLVGVAIPGTEKYYLANNTTGTFITPSFPTQAALDAFILTQTPPMLLALDTTIGTSTPVAGSGGNLNVHGNTQLGDSSTDTTTVSGGLAVNGISTTNGIDNTGDKITNLANGTAASDAAAFGQIGTAVDAEALIRGNADIALGGRIDTEVTNRTNADNSIRTDFAAADTALGGRIDTEVTNRTNADNSIRTDFAAADTALGGRIDTEVTDRTNADNSIRTDFAAADTVERNARIAADNTLGGRIDTEVSARMTEDVALGLRIIDEQSARIVADNALNIRVNNTDLRLTNEVNRLDGRINGVAQDLTNETNNRIAADNSLRAGIDENTRGIAMVAAMTNTHVEAGKTHGVDFNMAQFQSETGFAFGYANRVNENVQVHGSIASTTDFDESVVRMGVAVQW